MAQNVKKIDWSAVLRIVILVLTAVAEVIGEDSNSEDDQKTKNTDKK